MARTNDDWLTELRARDERAVADLRVRMLRALRSALSRRRGAGEEDVEDLAQDAMIRILDRLESFRGDSRFETWAASVAIRSAFTTLRRRHWQDVSFDELELPERAGASEDEPEHAAEQGDLLLALRRAIDEDLTDRQRKLILAELAGMPTARLVEVLETNPNALYKLYHDARKNLRAALTRRGFDANEVRSLTDGAS